MPGEVAIDWAGLRVFEAVARLGSMTRAAAELNTVQSNVTARIRQLEAELGTALFLRHGRGVALSTAGKRLLPYAERIRLLLDEARRAASDDGEPSGPLVIGSLETTAALRLSPVLTPYAAAYPKVDLSLVTGTSSELVEAVLQQRVEGAFVCGPVQQAELEEEPFFEEELVLLTAPSVRSLERALSGGQVRIVVLRAGCSYRQRLEDVLAQRGILGVRRLEFGTLEAIYACVAAGLGVTLLPRAVIGPVWREGRVAVHRLPRNEALVSTLFVRHRDAYRSSALEAFLSFARAVPPRLRAA